MGSKHSKLIPVSEMTENGRRMFRDNFFHAIAMELHRSGFYQLVQLERSAFNTLSRFQADMVSLINLNENWGRIVEKEQGLLLQIHERFRNLVSCWTHFAVSDSEHLISAISGLMDVSVTKHDAIESLVTLQQEIDHEAPKKYGKIMEKALGRLSAQHHDQVDFISQLNLDRMPDAYSRFNAGPLYLKFVKTPDHKLGKTIDRLIREGIVLVREADGLDAQYFRGPSGSIEELWISWDFSNKAKVKQTYLGVSADTAHAVETIVYKEGIKKDQVAMELFSRLSEKGEVKRRLGEKICLYWDREDQEASGLTEAPQYFPGISLRPEEFWPLAMNLTIFHETRDALALEVVEERNPILIRYLNVPSRNKGRFRACINPVSI